MRGPNVLIVDDRRVYAEALAHRMAGGASPGAVETVGVVGAGDAIERVRPRLVLLDLDRAAAEGPRLVERAAADPCRAGVVGLTDGSDAAAMAAAVRAGARAIVLKQETPSHLDSVLAGVVAGETHIPPGALTAVLGLLLSGHALNRDEELVGRLTERERDVLRLMVRGKSRADIAATMFVSLNTVRTHTRNLLRKLGARSGVEAVCVARRAGMV